MRSLLLLELKRSNFRHRYIIRVAVRLFFRMKTSHGKQIDIGDVKSL